MNFADRMALECMINKSMYAKYQDALKKQPNEFQLQKIKYKDDILNIVEQLLSVASDNDDNSESGKNECGNDADANNADVDSDDELILHPQVVNRFDDFARSCIENIRDFLEEKNKEKEEDAIAPIFTEEEDERKNQKYSVFN